MLDFPDETIHLQTPQLTKGPFHLIMIKLIFGDNIQSPRPNICEDNNIRSLDALEKPAFVVAFDEELMKTRTPGPDVSPAVSSFVFLLIKIHFRFIRCICSL